MVTASPMATRSSLELMLDKIQQLEDRPNHGPPSLPVRPVSRARLPRSRKALEFDLQRINSEEIDVNSESGFSERRITYKEEIAESNCVSSSAALAVDSKKYDDLLNEICRLKDSKVIVEKAIPNIQKCYRGHRVRCYFNELRRGVVALQSFARGENARKEFQCRVKRLQAIFLIQKHTRKYIECRLLKDQHSSAITSQSDNQGHWAQTNGDKMIVKPKSRDDKTADRNDHTRVPYNVIAELQKRVLRTEAKVREKKEENIALKSQLQEMEKKRMQYEERMNSMEKSWQDQLTHIQQCLVAAKKNPSPTVKFGQFLSIQEHYDHHGNSNVVITEVPSGRSLDSLNTSTYEHVDRLKLGNCNFTVVGLEQVSHKCQPEEELRKLKLRYKAWKKDYKNKLRETQSTFKKLSHSETSRSQRNNWWGRLSN